MHIEQIPAYLTWPMRQEVMYPEKRIDELKLPDDEEGIHFGLFSNNQLVSVISWFKRGEDAQFRKFATKKESQGKGFGTALLQYVLQFTHEEGCSRIWCNAREYAAPFYEKFGFSKTESRYEADGYQFVVMELILDSKRSSKSLAN